MDETTLISTLQSHLETKLDPPVRTSAMEDERPVPAIIIEDWNTTDFNFNNSALSGSYTGDSDLDGTYEHERYLTFDFKTRVGLLVRDSDEVDVTRLKDDVKHELRMIRENPQDFHSDIKQCRLGAGGNPTFTFTEPKEAELALSARFHGDHTVTVTDDLIQDVIKTFTFNP